MSVAHFSKFAAGFELALAETEDISTDTTIVEKVVDYCSDGKAGNIPVVLQLQMLMLEKTCRI